LEHDQSRQGDASDADEASQAEQTRPPSEDEPAAPEQPISPEPASEPAAFAQEPSPSPASEPPDEASAPSEGSDQVLQSAEQPAPSAEPGAEGVASAEIESWPSQEASSEAGASGATAAAGAWPTEPPAAGSAGPEAWPTAAPERGDEPIAEPEWGDAAAAGSAAAAGAGATPEPPPSEVEAYPAGEESDGGTAAATAAAVGAAHTVPADEAVTGESTQCPRCGTENRPGLAFCRNCGQRLVAAGVASTVARPGTPEGTMACPRCGTHNRAGVAFCQNCGANLRGTAAGYVPPAVAGTAAGASAAVERRGAILGPVVLLIGLVGLVTGYLLPFPYGSGSLFERAMGADGYGLAFWTAYPDVGASLADQIYFGLAAPIPLLCVLLLALAIAGFARAAPGPLQTLGLGIGLIWAVGLAVMFVLVELLGNWSGDIVGMLRVLSAAGIIFFLSSLIVVIGTLTRFGRS
jgi:hypothetical protein